MTIQLKSKSDIERKIPYDLTYMGNLKNKQTNKQKPQAHRYRDRQMTAIDGAGGWAEWERGSKDTVFLL